MLGQVVGWETYGPLGLVIATLLGAFSYLYRDKISRERELDERHTSERSEWRTEARQERTEILTMHKSQWEESRGDFKTALTENAKAVSALESAVRDLHIDVKAKRIADLKKDQE